MSSIKKDLTIIYMFRNGIASFMITVIAFAYHIMEYYQITLSQALHRMMMDNIYTVLYFLLIWVLNYVVLEIYKMVYDISKETTYSYIRLLLWFGIPVITTLVMSFILPNLFTINGVLLGLFMMVNAILRILKNRRVRLF